MIPRVAQKSLAIVLLACATASAAPNGWAHFVSKQSRFSAWYPPGWQPLTPGSVALEIVDFPKSEAVTGAVVPERGALIQAWPASDPADTIEKLIQRQTTIDGDVAPDVDQTLLTGLRYPDSPRTLRQVEYVRNEGSAVHPILQHVTMYYCKVHGRIFEVMLIYFRGNKKAKQLEAAARSVARSLRIQK